MCFSQRTLGISVRSLASVLFLIRSIPHIYFYWTLDFHYLEKTMFIFNSREKGLILERTEGKLVGRCPPTMKKLQIKFKF